MLAVEVAFKKVRRIKRANLQSIFRMRMRRGHDNRKQVSEPQSSVKKQFLIVTIKIIVLFNLPELRDC